MLILLPYVNLIVTSSIEPKLCLMVWCVKYNMGFCTCFWALDLLVWTHVINDHILILMCLKGWHQLNYYKWVFSSG
jgi:hypothetical protein